MDLMAGQLQRVAEATARPLVIGGWLADRDGVGYYRVKVPFDELERRGHSVEYDAAMRWQLGKRPARHVLVGQRVSNEGTSAQWQAAAGDVRRVFEVDDDLLNVDPSSAAAFAFYAQPDVRRRLLENMRSADAITVSTEYLAQVIRSDHGVTAPVHVLPNCLDPRVFELPPVDQSGPMTVGWAGSDTHFADLKSARYGLERFFGRYPDVPLTMMGVNHSPMHGTATRFRPWHPMWNDPLGYMGRLDWQVGLAPLVNHQFNRAKSALKVLEYGARGMVVVASDVEPYSRYVLHGITGFLVDRPDQWGEYLALLEHEPELRARMGVAARQQAAEWTIDKHAHLWEKAYGCSV